MDRIWFRPLTLLVVLAMVALAGLASRPEAQAKTGTIQGASAVSVKKNIASLASV